MRLVTTAQVKMNKVLVKFVRRISNVNAYCVVMFAGRKKIITHIKEAERSHCQDKYGDFRDIFPSY